MLCYLKKHCSIWLSGTQPLLRLGALVILMPPSSRKRTAQGPAAAAHSSTKRNHYDPIIIEAPCAAFANSPYLSNLASMYEGKQLTDVVIITTNRVNKKEEKIRAHRQSRAPLALRMLCA